MKPELDATNPPYKLVQLAKEANGDVDTFLADLEFHDDLSGVRCTRQQAREIMQFATVEAEKDALASAPTGIDVLESKANKFLGMEIDRLTREAGLYQRIAESSDENDYEIQSTGETISPGVARERLHDISTRMMAIKTSLANEKKSSQEKEGGAMTVNLGVIVGNAIDNIKNGEGHYIPTTVKQVESVASKPDGEN